MQCPNCGKEAININGREICLDCGIEIAQNISASADSSTDVQSADTSLEIDDSVFKDTSTEGDIDTSLDGGREEISSFGTDLEQSSPEQFVSGETRDNLGGEGSSSPEETDIANDQLSNDDTKGSLQVPRPEEKTTVSDVSEEEKTAEKQEGEDIPVFAAVEKEELPKLNLGNPRSEKFEEIESEPFSETNLQTSDIKPEKGSFEEPEDSISEIGLTKLTKGGGQSEIKAQEDISQKKEDLLDNFPNNLQVSNFSQMPKVDSINYGNVYATNQTPKNFSNQGFSNISNTEILPVRGITGKMTFKRALSVLVVFIILLTIFGILWFFRGKVLNLVNIKELTESVE